MPPATTVTGRGREPRLWTLRSRRRVPGCVRARRLATRGGSDEDACTGRGAHPAACWPWQLRGPGLARAARCCTGEGVPGGHWQRVGRAASFSETR